MLFSYVDNFELQEKMMVTINNANIKFNINLGKYKNKYFIFKNSYNILNVIAIF